MKKQKTQSKIIVALTAVVILLVAISATLTFAYFTANQSATSQTMTFGKLVMGDIELAVTESEDHLVTSNEQGHVGEISYLVPGCLITLDGDIMMTSNIDYYARFKIGITVSGNALADTQLVRDALSIDTTGQDNNAAGWIMDTAPSTLDNNVLWTGWYYKLLSAGNGSTAVNILDLSKLSFTFPVSMDNTWQDKVVTIKIVSQAIQAEHLSIPDGDDADENPDAFAKAAVTAQNVATVGTITAWTAAGTQNNANAA